MSAAFPGGAAPYIVACLIGLLGGLIDLLSKQGWPDKYMLSPPAVIYVVLNAVASGIALLVANLLQLSLLGLSAQSDGIIWARALIAGLGGVALIRTSIGKHSDPTRSLIRLAGWFEDLMDMAIAELADGRQRAVNAPPVHGIMRRVSFQRSASVLILRLNTAHPDKDNVKLASQKMDELKRNRRISDRDRSFLFGEALAQIYSVDKLRAAVQLLGDDIRATS